MQYWNFSRCIWQDIFPRGRDAWSILMSQNKEICVPWPSPPSRKTSSKKSSRTHPQIIGFHIPVLQVFAREMPICQHRHMLMLAKRTRPTHFSVLSIFEHHQSKQLSPRSLASFLPFFSLRRWRSLTRARSWGQIIFFFLTENIYCSCLLLPFAVHCKTEQSL